MLSDSRTQAHQQTYYLILLSGIFLLDWKVWSLFMLVYLFVMANKSAWWNSIFIWIYTFSLTLYLVHTLWLVLYLRVGLFWLNLILNFKVKSLKTNKKLFKWKVFFLSFIKSQEILSKKLILIQKNWNKKKNFCLKFWITFSSFSSWVFQIKRWFEYLLRRGKC